jgi:hypothetical protein
MVSFDDLGDWAEEVSDMFDAEESAWLRYTVAELQTQSKARFIASGVVGLLIGYLLGVLL